MKLLLTSSGVSNPSIHNALVDLLGKPVAESERSLCPDWHLPFSGGTAMAYKAVCGQAPTPLCELGWKSLGLLELTALPSIDRNAWAPSVEKTDALLVWGGDPLFLSYWMNQSGLTDLLKSMERFSRVCRSQRRKHVGSSHLRRNLPEAISGNRKPAHVGRDDVPCARRRNHHEFHHGKGSGLYRLRVDPTREPQGSRGCVVR